MTSAQPHAASRADAVVVGAGPNGLVAANLLADAGWDVTVLEAQPVVGGAVRSDRDVDAGFVHDTCSSFYPMAAASPVIRALGLERFGLRWEHAPAVLGNPLPTGGWALLHHDRERTAASLEADAEGDGETWLRLCRHWDQVGHAFVDTLLSPLPPVRPGLRLLARSAPIRDVSLLDLVSWPARTLCRQLFRGDAARLLVAGNALHADIPMDAPGSGLIGWLLSMLGQDVGFPVPRGGAGELSRSLERRLQARGGVVRVGTRCSRVVVERGRATGVVTEAGERIDVTRAVLADVVAPSLYGGLVDWAHLPARLRRRMRRFEWDPATFKVDWALDRPVPWRDAPAEPPGTVHIAASLEELAQTQVEITNGTLPDRPFLLLGQMTTTDPTRSPTGTESLWAYTHVPHGLVWDASAKEEFADRMQERVEAHAPGLASLVRARRILGPDDLEGLDESLVGGALNGGTASLHQQAVLRPTLGLGRAETPVAGLYLASASAHPGGAVHGACGANAARAALFHDRLGTTPLRTGFRRLVAGCR